MVVIWWKLPQLKLQMWEDNNLLVSHIHDDWYPYLGRGNRKLFSIPHTRAALKRQTGEAVFGNTDITKEAFWDSKSTARAAFTLLLLSHSLSSGTSPVKASVSSIFSSWLPLSPRAGWVPASVRGLTAGGGWCDTHKCCIEESPCISLHSERSQVIQSWGCYEEEDNGT